MQSAGSASGALSLLPMQACKCHLATGAQAAEKRASLGASPSALLRHDCCARRQPCACMLSQPSSRPLHSQQVGASPAAHSQRDLPAVAFRPRAPRRHPLSPGAALQQQTRPEARPAPMSNHILLKPSAVSSHDAETSDYRIQAPNVEAMEVRRPVGGSGRPCCPFVPCSSAAVPPWLLHIVHHCMH